MSLNTDIQKLTQIPYCDENSLFILQQEYNTMKRNRRMKKFKSPQNEGLFDNDDNLSQCFTDVTQEPCFLPTSEIASSIKEATGGIDYSNEKLEEQWKIRQLEASLSSQVLNKKLSLVNNHCDYKNSVVETDIDSLSEIKTDEKHKIKDEENILKQCRLNKNAAIRGLIKHQLISVKDLEIPVNSTDPRYENNKDVQSTKMYSPNNLEEDYCMRLVPHKEDPEIFIQPIQAEGGIDASKYKNIDFTVPHIGKKKVVTSRQFFLSMDDSDFDFVKRDIEPKK